MPRYMPHTVRAIVLFAGGTAKTPRGISFEDSPGAFVRNCEYQKLRLAVYTILSSKEGLNAHRLRRLVPCIVLVCGSPDVSRGSADRYCMQCSTKLLTYTSHAINPENERNI